MKTGRIIFIVPGWVLIALDILSRISMDSYHTESGVGYSIGYETGRHIVLLFGLLLLFFAYRINKKLKKKKADAEMNSFLEN